MHIFSQTSTFVNHIPLWCLLARALPTKHRMPNPGVDTTFLNVVVVKSTANTSSKPSKNDSTFGRGPSHDNHGKSSSTIFKDNNKVEPDRNAYDVIEQINFGALQPVVRRRQRSAPLPKPTMEPEAARHEPNSSIARLTCVISTNECGVHEASLGSTGDSPSPSANSLVPNQACSSKDSRLEMMDQRMAMRANGRSISVPSIRNVLMADQACSPFLLRKIRCKEVALELQSNLKQELEEKKQQKKCKERNNQSSCSAGDGQRQRSVSPVSSLLRLKETITEHTKISKKKKEVNKALPEQQRHRSPLKCFSEHPHPLKSITRLHTRTRTTRQIKNHLNLAESPLGTHHRIVASNVNSTLRNELPSKAQAIPLTLRNRDDGPSRKEPKHLKLPTIVHPSDTQHSSDQGRLYITPVPSTKSFSSPQRPSRRPTNIQASIVADKETSKNVEASVMEHERDSTTPTERISPYHMSSSSTILLLKADRGRSMHTKLSKEMGGEEICTNISPPLIVPSRRDEMNRRSRSHARSSNCIIDA
jgi:hypothetical protein